MKIAVIPARSGSKRIPRKNVRLFLGRPLIAYPIQALRESCLFDHVIVSTDSSEIANIARDEGAEAPFLRPPDLADDFTPTLDVVTHAIDQLTMDSPPYPEYVCCAYPTAPLLRASTLVEAFQLIEADATIRFCFSVVRFGFPPQRGLTLLDTGGVEPVDSTAIAMRSQDLEPIYHDAGQFYWGRTAAWLDGKGIYGANSRAFILDRLDVQDIDDKDDWALAESLYRLRHTAERTGRGSL